VTLHVPDPTVMARIGPADPNIRDEAIKGRGEGGRTDLSASTQKGNSVPIVA